MNRIWQVLSHSEDKLSEAVSNAIIKEMKEDIEDPITQDEINRLLS